MSETQIEIRQAQIKVMVIILLQELQSSVPPCPKIRACGLPQSGLFSRYVIVVISELFQNNHAHLQSVTQAWPHDPSANYRTAPRPKCRGFKFEKHSRKGCDTFERKMYQTPLPARPSTHLGKLVLRILPHLLAYSPTNP